MDPCHPGASGSWIVQREVFSKSMRGIWNHLFCFDRPDWIWVVSEVIGREHSFGSRIFHCFGKA
jgi:hypothetical protein